jgi:hypothetical protein
MPCFPSSLSKCHFLLKELDTSLAVRYYFESEVKDSEDVTQILSSFLSFYFTCARSRRRRSFSFSPSSAVSHRSLPYLSLASNQMEHIKSGARHRQWLL